MCGIAGFVSLSGENLPCMEAALTPMIQKLTHRGPDDEGSYIAAGVALGHRRLSIIDLEGGHQPIGNEDGTVQAVVNGEIYNFAELRAELEATGHRFSTRSDSEVIVHLYEAHGQDFVKRLRGMFALALWDGKRGRLLLARDRFGIKPLYYSECAGQLVFASEIRALLAHPDLSAEPDMAAVFEYLCLRYVPGPGTALAGVRKLMPGHVLVSEDGGLRQEPYWSLPEPGEGSLPSGEELLAALADAVRSHLVSDVPVGVFLSGGLDSSLMVALMRQAGADPLRTFTMGFPVPGADERDHAEAIARHFDTDHVVLQLQPAGPEELEEVLSALEEPISDPAVLPTYLLAREARKHVKVVLTGEGSDEINGGYQRYWFARCAARLAPWPAGLRRLAARLPLPGRLRHALTVSLAPEGVKARLLGFDFFGPTSPDEILDGELREAAAGRKLETVLGERLMAAGGSDFERRLYRADMRGWMVDDLLMKVDKMTMAHGLEARVPYLDHLYAEVALRVPPAERVRGLSTKAALRRAAASLLPSETVRRRQHGFNVPLAAWLKGDFGAYARSVVLGDRAMRRHLFRREWVESTVSAAESRGGVYAGRLWALLVLELWMRECLD